MIQRELNGESVEQQCGFARKDKPRLSGFDSRRAALHAVALQEIEMRVSDQFVFRAMSLLFWLYVILVGLGVIR